ncbi:MAG: CbtB domain-containing protein [Thermoleophilaceae bacterium]
MSESVTAPPLGSTVHPPAVSFGQAWPWGIFLVAMLMLFYFVGVDEGAASMVPGTDLHEWLHDGRHLLGLPCH